MPASWLKWRQLNYRKPSDVWHKHAHAALAHSPQVMDDFQDRQTNAQAKFDQLFVSLPSDRVSYNELSRASFKTHVRSTGFSPKPNDFRLKAVL